MFLEWRVLWNPSEQKTTLAVCGGHAGSDCQNWRGAVSFLRRVSALLCQSWLICEAGVEKVTVICDTSLFHSLACRRMGIQNSIRIHRGNLEEILSKLFEKWKTEYSASCSKWFRCFSNRDKSVWYSLFTVFHGTQLRLHWSSFQATLKGFVWIVQLKNTQHKMDTGVYTSNPYRMSWKVTPVAGGLHIRSQVSAYCMPITRAPEYYKHS